MNLVTVKNKYQIVIPALLRKKVNIAIGDILEVKAERGKIMLSPKSIIDREIAEALEDIRVGRVFGPYSNISKAHAAFQKRTRLQNKQARR